MSNKIKSAFTLAEIMVVLLVLTILFAGFAPVVTKKIRTRSPKGQDMWQWSTRNYMAGPMDAYYNSGNSDNNFGEVFFGISPNSAEDIHTTYLPYSKVVLRSGPVTTSGIAQRQMQFRYGYSQAPYGDFQSSLFADTSNIFLGGKYNNLHFNNKNKNENYPSNNFAFGKNALESVKYTVDEIPATASSKSVKNNTAVGYNALNKLEKGENNTVIGANAGSNSVESSNNTIIGYNAGSGNLGNSNVLIGANANSGSGSGNTIIGYNAGGSINGSYNYNTAVGFEALDNIVSGDYNIALGAKALKNLNQGSYNVAIGYKACSNVRSGSKKTCIGANSGPREGNGNDEIQRTYIGSAPFGENNYGGDAVLEIHNPESNNSYLNNKPDINSNTTTVINGNLIVRGKTFFTVGNILYPFYYKNNIFSAVNTPCAYSQTTNNFNTDNCSELINISSSDRRLKNIGSSFNSGINDIEKINIFNYTFIKDKDKLPHTGVMAQDLEKIFPNSVSKDKNGYLKIRWDEMFFSSINAIKQMNKKIVTAIKNLTNIEKKITKLEKENQDLEKQIEILSAKINNLSK